MIEIGWSKSFSGVTVCLRGRQLTSEFLEIPTLLMGRCRQEQPLKVLFDWAELEYLRLTTEDTLRVEEWIRIGGSIERAAIIHHHRWNRSAAWLAAALRLGGSEVHSFRETEFSKALDWLIASG